MEKARRLLLTVVVRKMYDGSRNGQTMDLKELQVLPLKDGRFLILDDKQVVGIASLPGEVAAVSQPEEQPVVRHPSLVKPPSYARTHREIHEQRAKIMEIMSAHPEGLPMAEIVEKFGFPKRSREAQAIRNDLWWFRGKGKIFNKEAGVYCIADQEMKSAG